MFCAFADDCLLSTMECQTDSGSPSQKMWPSGGTAWMIARKPACCSAVGCSRITSRGIMSQSKRGAHVPSVALVSKSTWMTRALKIGLPRSATTRDASFSHPVSTILPLNPASIASYLCVNHSSNLSLSIKSAFFNKRSAESPQ